MRDIATARGALFRTAMRQERVLNLIPILARYGRPLVDADARRRAARMRDGIVGRRRGPRRAAAPSACDRDGAAIASRCDSAAARHGRSCGARRRAASSSSRLLGLVRQSADRALPRARPVAADAFNGGVQDSELPAEPVRRRRALGVVHSRLRERCSREDDEEEAGRVAGAVGAMLALVVVGHRAASASSRRRSLIPLIAPGFDGEKRELTIRLDADPVSRRGHLRDLGVVPRRPQQPPQVPAVVRGAGALEHRDDRRAARGSGRAGAESIWRSTLAWASVVGARAAVPRAAADGASRSLGHLRFALDYDVAARPHACSRNFGPVFVSRGVVQISGYIDHVASRAFCRTGIVATARLRADDLSCCRSACSACRSRRPSCRRCRARSGSEDEIARVSARAARRAAAADRVLRRSVGGGVPRVRRRDRRACCSSAAGSPRRTRCTRGAFSPASAVGLLASDAGPPLLVDVLRAARHAHAAALRDRARRAHDGARLPVRAVRCRGCSASIAHWGAAGLTASAGIAGWVEFSLLRSRLNRRIGRTGLPRRFVALALGLGRRRRRAPAWGMRGAARRAHRFVRGVARARRVRRRVPGASTVALGVPEARALLARRRVARPLTRRVGRAVASRGYNSAWPLPESVLDKIPHLPESPGRVSLARRGRDRAVRRQGEAAALARAQLRRAATIARASRRAR